VHSVPKDIEESVYLALGTMNWGEAVGEF
jgi:hypothetical protein